ncbi:hypothetical protein ACKVMT_00345 [Halobacteriales archaeon Cl-PHB]
MVNAFWLDRNLEQAAAWHVDRHVTSAILECSMVLTAALDLRDYPDEAGELYVTHQNHPLTRWAARSLANWDYLYDYVAAVHDEWLDRYDHDPEDVHGCWETVLGLDRAAVEALDWPTADRADPPQVTGDWQADDYVDAYRYYYVNEKRHLFEWSGGRTQPPWVDEYTE